MIDFNSDHGLSFAGEEARTMVSDFPFLYRFTVLLNSGGSNSPWSEFWSEFPHSWGWGSFPHRQVYHFSLGICLTTKVVDCNDCLAHGTLGVLAGLQTLALFRSLCNKGQLSRKNKSDKLSGMFPELVFVAF